jgi:hypothetical protein
LDSLPLIFFLALIAAAVVLRRCINDPANPIGRWWVRTIQSRWDRSVQSWFNLGFKIFLFLTAVLWLTIYLSAPDDKKGGGLKELFAPLTHPEGRPEVGGERTAPVQR